MLPDGVNRAASCPNRAAACSCSSCSVGSSSNTSSPTGAAAMAARMAAVGRVTVSERRSANRSATQHLRDEERQLQGLLRVEPRVARGLIPVGEVLVDDRLGAAEAFGDVLAGELDVQAAGVGLQLAVDLEVAEDLV